MKLKEFFQSKAYRVRNIKTPANICFYAPSVCSAFGILTEAMRRCVQPSSGQPVSRAVCRQASSGSAMTDAESWGRCPACGLYSAVPGNHTLYRSVKPRAVFSAFRPCRSAHQRRPTTLQPDLFHSRKRRLRSRKAACRFRRQGRELSVLSLCIRGRRLLLRACPVRPPESALNPVA